MPFAELFCLKTVKCVLAGNMFVNAVNRHGVSTEDQ